jgi:hypothetical protein
MVNVHILASTSVSFALTTVQVLNLALTHAKWITVYTLGDTQVHSHPRPIKVYRNIGLGLLALAFSSLPPKRREHSVWLRV